MSTRCPAHVKRTAALTRGEGSVFSLLRRRTFLFLLLGSALLVAWFVATAVLFIWPRTDHATKADAVVVLSGGRDRRLDPALSLMRRGVAPVLVISGAGNDEGWTSARKLCADGDPRFQIICFDPKPYSTRGEARQIELLARAHDWHKVDVVTSDYHVFRARLLLRRCYHRGLAVVGTSYPWQTAVYSWFAEWVKLAYQVTFARSC